MPKSEQLNVRFWHEADKLTELKVRFERKADFPTHKFITVPIAASFWIVLLNIPLSLTRHLLGSILDLIEDVCNLANSCTS